MPNTSTIILGVTKPEQLDEQLEALDLIPKITAEVREKVEAILDNKPNGP